MGNRRTTPRRWWWRLPSILMHCHHHPLEPPS
jgi:hypothetical protein